MDIRNIKIGIANVAIILVQAITVVWMVAKMAAKLDGLTETTAAIQTQQEREAQDNKIWKAKIEADLADLKVRTALLEARVNSIGHEK
jgi:hypothetical protein